jgi:DNA-directed RNA polymerase specialized sigma24 family protein
MAGRDDTEMGGVPAVFPSTRWAMLRDARDRGSPGYREAMGDLCRVYWKPVYHYLRASRPMDNERAKDLTQQFMMDIVEGDFLSRFSPDHGSFRGYLRGALRLYLLEEHRDATALKRGGGRSFLSIDREDPGADPLGGDPEKIFDRRWADTVLDQAVAALRGELEASGKELSFRVFDRYELNPPPGGPPSYADLSRDYSLKETDVSNVLHACRKRLRELIVLRIRDYVSSEADVASEILRLFAE